MRFPGVLACDGVSLSINGGEIFALVGENGAGKSTLMNILYGLLRPTAGEITVRGQALARHSPEAAIALGIGMVHQHFMLVPSFTVAQNIVQGIEPKKYGIFYDFKAAEEAAHSLSTAFGLAVDPKARVMDLGLGLQQRVEILKALHRGADILVLDEPTAVLTPQEADELFSVLRRIVRERGMTVILITHKLQEVMAISGRVGVMRAGKLVAVRETCDITERELAAMMVGSDVPHEAFLRENALPDVAIDIRGAEIFDDRGLPAVRGVRLTVRRGEILGIAGIEGNGQSELIEAVTGLRALSGGEIRLLGRSVSGLSPGEVRALGIAHIPEDRLLTGVSAQASVMDNLIAGKQRAFSALCMHLKRRAARAYAQRLYSEYDIRGAGVDVASGSLSGGNLQKVVVAREFSFDATALVIAQPTRGVDIGAIAFIHRLIIEKRNAGCAVLLVSADLDEIFRLSDRIVTIFEGRVTGEFDAATAGRAEVGLAMTGGGDS